MALKRLVNGREVELTSEEETALNKEWSDNAARKQKQMNNYEYKRRQEYPSVVDQLDLLWHAIDLNQDLKASDFYATIKAVKDKYPKPAER